MKDTIQEIKKDYEALTHQLSNPELISDWEKSEEIIKRRNLLKQIIDKEEELINLNKEIEENRGIIATETDPELTSLAKEEMASILERRDILKGEIQKLVNSIKQAKKEDSNKTNPESVIVEIRAGTGGDEAGLFAADLFKMYSRYAQDQGWKQKILDSRPTELGGFKEITFEIDNKNAWPKIRYEGGVHRVQRIPETEKSGRIHTSTATVAILPKPKKTGIAIKPDDLRIDIYKSSGPGGQNVNKRMTAVRITHLPTGIVVASQNERNQAQNKENAMAILEAKLLEKKEKEEAEKIGDKRKTQIGWAKRAEKIRTYNFPQDRVTDHRIKKSWHNIEGIMEGKLDPIIEALQKADK